MHTKDTTIRRHSPQFGPKAIRRTAAAASALLWLAAPASLHAQQTLYVATNSPMPGSGTVIDQISPVGMVSTFATLPAGSIPEGVAFGPGGSLYAADLLNSRVLQISPAGAVSTFAALPTPADSNPVGLAFGAAGNLYVASTTNSQVSKISPVGVVSAFASVNPGYSLNGLAFDTQGNLYSADGNSNQISKLSPTGTVSLFATVPASTAQNPNGVEGLAFDASGNLYAADYDTNQVFRISSGGVLSLFATLPANSGPMGLAFDASGNLYAADSGTSQISKISSDGLTVSTFASNVNSPTYLTFGTVPEPSTWALALLGGGVMVACYRGRQRAGGRRARHPQTFANPGLFEPPAQ